MFEWSIRVPSIWDRSVLPISPRGAASPATIVPHPLVMFGEHPPSTIRAWRIRVRFTIARPAWGAGGGGGGGDDYGVNVKASKRDSFHSIHSDGSSSLMKSPPPPPFKVEDIDEDKVFVPGTPNATLIVDEMIDGLQVQEVLLEDSSVLAGMKNSGPTENLPLRRRRPLLLLLLLSPRTTMGARQRTTAAALPLPTTRPSCQQEVRAKRNGRRNPPRGGGNITVEVKIDRTRVNIRETENIETNRIGIIAATIISRMGRSPPPIVRAAVVIIGRERRDLPP